MKAFVEEFVGIISVRKRHRSVPLAVGRKFATGLLKSTDVNKQSYLIQNNNNKIRVVMATLYCYPCQHKMVQVTVQ